jgi:hypothetical protein
MLYDSFLSKRTKYSIRNQWIYLKKRTDFISKIQNNNFKINIMSLKTKRS